MSTPTIANANSDFFNSDFFNMLRDVDFPVYHGDDEPVDAPSAAPPADVSSTNDEMQFTFDELEAMIDSGGGRAESLAGSSVRDK